jgi:hypothetical protein
MKSELEITCKGKHGYPDGLCLLYDVFGEATIESNAPGVEVLTQEGIPAPAIEAVIALRFSYCEWIVSGVEFNLR